MSTSSWESAYAILGIVTKHMLPPNFDNTDNKSNIGGNTSIALSLANYVCAAKYKEMPSRHL